LLVLLKFLSGNFSSKEASKRTQDGREEETGDGVCLDGREVVK
jgi:hypothetical protein